MRFIFILVLLLLTGRLVFGQAPTISYVNPTIGAVGAAAWVAGTNFGSSQGSSTITVNGVSATASIWSATGALITIPSTTTGPVVVTTTSGSSNSITFTISTATITPTLPQATVNLAFPMQGSSTCPTYLTGTNCIRNVPLGSDSGSSELQNTLNVAGCGDTLVLTAGSTYSGNFTVPQTTCSGWIVIESSALSSIPASGNRLNPTTYGSDLAIVSTPNSSAAVTFNASSNHWRLVGLELTTSVTPGNAVYWLVGLGQGVTTASTLPSYIIFDRCYIFGNDSTSTTIQHGIYADGAYVGVVDSYCDGIIDSGEDAQCIISTNGTGPFLIQNNFLQATGEDIMFGGSDPYIANLVPSDITIIGNLFQKNYSAWEGVISDIKNHFEIKNAQRVLLDGNVFQYTWESAQNESILIRSVDQGDGPPSRAACNWCTALDVTVTHNLIQHAPEAIALASIEATSNPSLPTGRVLIRNNVMSDISCTSWGVGADTYCGELVPIGLIPSPYVMHDVIVDHNTGFVDNNTTNCTTAGCGLMYISVGSGCGSSAGPLQNLQLTNNISDYGTMGVSSQCYSPGSSYQNYILGNDVYNQIVFLNSSGSSQSGFPSGSLWNTIAGTDFTSVTGTDPNLSGNFQLTSSSSYYQQGTDGYDIGVYDWTCYNATTTAALNGTYSSATPCYDGSGIFGSSALGVSFSGAQLH